MKALLFLLFFLAIPARADYGWIPEYQKLITKLGLDVFKSTANYNNTGTLTSLPSNAELKDTTIWLSAEYGLAESWAMAVEFPFVMSALDGTSSRLADGSGIGDITARLKWAVKPISPIITLETYLKFPTGRAVSATGQMALGDGNFDLGIFLHSGHKGGRFLFSVSPGFLARFGGYSLAVAGEIAAQVMFPRGFLRAFFSGIYSFQDLAPFDSSFTSHDAQGSGGSFAKLNGSPIGFGVGGKLGLQILKEVGLEFTFTKSLFGSRYPDYFKVGGDVVVELDFFEPPKKVKAKEVPFDFDYDKY